MGESISQTEVQRLRGMSRASLEAAHVALMTTHQALRDERDQLIQAYTATKFELALMKKRLFIAKAERVDVSQLEIEFADKLAALDALSKRLEPLPAGLTPAQPPGGARAKAKPTGRRDFSEEDLPEERVEVVDPAKEGVLPRAGFEVSYRLMWRRGGMVRVKTERVKYRDASQPDVDGSGLVTVAPMPPDLFPRSMATPSLVTVAERDC